MGDVGITVHSQPAGGRLAMPARSVPGELRHVNDIAFAGDYHRLSLDRVANLSCHDEPEFGALRVVVALVIGVERPQVLLIAVDEIRYRTIVVHKARSSASLLADGRELVPGDVRLVAVIVGKRLTPELDFDPIDS